MKQGFVYFIEELGADRIKIGFSTHPWKRLSGLSTSTAAKLVLRWVFAGTRADEKHFHWLFQNHRIRGEWFTLSSVIAGFRHYGAEPDNFEVPDRSKFQPIPVEYARKVYPIVVDPEKFERDARGYLIRKRKPRSKNKAFKPKKGRRGGVKWSSEEYQAKVSGMTVAQFRQMKKRIRDEWERDHPGEVPYWRTG